MAKVVHVAVTDSFAGVERYMCTTAVELARRRWDVAVIGGEKAPMESALAGAARWLPGATIPQALTSLKAAGRADVCHVHMTAAETAGLLGRLVHRGALVSTRHFAARRGSSLGGRVLSPILSRALGREIAISDFVASRIERPPDAVIPNGVPLTPRVWDASSRVVLVLQRMEPEKETSLALRAWKESRLSDAGWKLRVVGDGSERAGLERMASVEGIPRVTFAGRVQDVAGEFADAAVLLATAPAEPFGLAVLEAMAAGVPVIAAASGAHLETVGRLPEPMLYDPGDADAAAAALRRLSDDRRRAAASDAARSLVEAEFTIARHVDLLEHEYAAAAPAIAEPVR